MSNKRRRAIKILDDLELITGQPIPKWSREAVLVAIMAEMYNSDIPDGDQLSVVNTIIAKEKELDKPFFGL